MSDKDVLHSGPRVTVTTAEIGHHAAHSGYGCFAGSIAAAHPDAEVLGPRPLPRRVPRRATRWLVDRAGPQWYCDGALSVELGVARRIVTRCPEVVHMLYGDQQLWYSTRSTRLAPRRPKLVCTFHQPPAVLEEVGPGVRRLDRIDAAITLADNQTRYFEELLGPDRVFAVSHGVDTEWWCPNGEVRSDLDCLFVGQWLRDKRVVRGVAERLAASAPDVRLRLAGAAPELVEDLQGLPNVRVLPRLSDEELRREYRRAGVLILPMLDATANCALLEAIACGTPTVVTDVGGVRSYVDETCAALTRNGDAEEMTARVLALLGDRARRTRLGDAAVERARRFDIRPVTEKIVDVYRTLAER